MRRFRRVYVYFKHEYPLGLGCISLLYTTQLSVYITMESVKVPRVDLVSLAVFLGVDVNNSIYPNRMSIFDWSAYHIRHDKSQKTIEMCTLLVLAGASTEYAIKYDFKGHLKQIIKNRRKR